MDSESDLTCPKCGNTMELITADEAGSLMRVCPVCATLAWNGKDGTVETREPQELTGEAQRNLLENRKFVTCRGGTREAPALEAYWIFRITTPLLTAGFPLTLAVEALGNPADRAQRRAR